jgi:signal transduction histidine kinase
MSIASYDSAYIATLAVVATGSLTFSVLMLYYWRYATPRRDPVFAAFTVVCAAAFLVNLLMRMEPRWETPLGAVFDLAAGMMGPVLFHLVSRNRKPWVTTGLYLAGTLTAGLSILDDFSVLTVPFRDQAAGGLLALACALGLLFLHSGIPRLRSWYRALLGLTVPAVLAGSFYPSALTVLAPDYLLLAFFCVTLYYRERLIFFDVLIKRGALFCFAAAALTLLLSAADGVDRLTIGLLITPLLLLSPWVDSMLGRLVDRVFLGRRYAPEDAERLVVCELQSAQSESDLRCRAERALSEVFRCAAEVRFGWPPAAAWDDALVAEMPNCGQIVLPGRASGIPYMTDDRRLLDSVARTLGMAIDNVRFREERARQLEREQHLRLLAGRAELKALRARINPHFLFNSLNAIAGLVPSRPDLADEAIEQLAQVFRYTLRKSEKEWALLDEETEFASAYLRLERARFGDRLEVSLEIDPEARGVSVPAMCIQPLIENAIRHGASALEGKGVVALRISVAGPMVSIEVCDNGPGFPAGFSLDGSEGHGLRNVAERLKGYYGESARLCWESGANSTRVLLEVPRNTPAIL